MVEGGLYMILVNLDQNWIHIFNGIIKKQSQLCSRHPTCIVNFFLLEPVFFFAEIYVLYVYEMCKLLKMLFSVKFKMNPLDKGEIPIKLPTLRMGVHCQCHRCGPMRYDISLIQKHWNDSPKVMPYDKIGTCNINQTATFPVPYKIKDNLKRDSFWRPPTSSDVPPTHKCHNINTF